MIVLRNKEFSNKMIEDLKKEIEKLGIEDFEVSDRIPRDNVSIGGSGLSDIRIYIPMDSDYLQYEIEDMLRKGGSLIRTQVTVDRNIYVMKVLGTVKLKTLADIAEHIIEDQGTITILENI